MPEHHIEVVRRGIEAFNQGGGAERDPGPGRGDGPGTHARTGQGHTSGVPIELDYVQLWTIRDGLVARVDKYENAAGALADCGVAR